jgi:hypothetical protein
MPSFLWNLLATNLALYLSIMPLALCLILYNHLQLMILAVGDLETKIQVSLDNEASNYFSIASH